MSKILVTGGRGKTGRRVAALLKDKEVENVIASHDRNNLLGHTYFDWTIPETWQKSLDGVSAVYLVIPSHVITSFDLIKRFLETAESSGVGRYVLLSASVSKPSDPGLGKIHQWLMQNAENWSVIRPSWMMQNFTEAHHLVSILSEKTVYSATQNGQVPFISADDIAAVATRLLTDEKIYNKDFILTGPEALSYDQVVKIITETIGKEITHTKVSIDVIKNRYLAGGLNPVYAESLALLDASIAAGNEAEITSNVELLTGKPPISFREFAMKEKEAWRKLYEAY